MQNIRVGKILIETLLFWFMVIAAIAISIWSFLVTQNFFHAEGGNTIETAFWLSVIFQYGQNLFLFLAMLYIGKTFQISPKVTIPYSVLFYAGAIFCGLIDAGTNVAEWRKMYAYSNQWTIINIVMHLVSVAVTFVEEIVGLAIGAAISKSRELFVEFGFLEDDKKQPNKPNFPNQPNNQPKEDKGENRPNIPMPPNFSQNKPEEKVMGNQPNMRQNNENRGRGRPPGSPNKNKMENNGHEFVPFSMMKNKGEE